MPSIGRCNESCVRYGRHCGFTTMCGRSSAIGEGGEAVDVEGGSDRFMFDDPVTTSGRRPATFGSP